MADYESPFEGEDELRAERRLAAWETELRDKYTQADRDRMAKSGEAMPDGSYPIADEDDLHNAISTVGLGNAPDSAIRAHIIKRAKALGLESVLPKAWNSDGSKSARSAQRKDRHRALPLSPEVRFFAPTQVEVRSQATKDSSEIVISGAAIMYGAQYRVVDMVGEFRETIHPGAATNLIGRGVDCRLLLNHEGLPMARTSSGTMKLIDSPDALRFEARLDARQQIANDFAIAIERGDLSQMSVGMVVSRDAWGSDGDTETRDIFQLGDLLDVSGVTYPCSSTTHIEVAHRMMNAMPIESRARLRRLELEVRAGATLSKASQGYVLHALKALHDLADAGGVDVSEFSPGGDENVPETTQDGSQGDGANLENDAGITYPDGSGQRSQADGETRDDPTPEDYTVTSGLQDLKAHLARVKAAQLHDPDSGTDPDDKAVLAAIDKMDAACDEAIVAQSKDSHEDAKPDAEPRASVSASTLRLLVEAGR